jgi:hypothetical protein
MSRERSKKLLAPGYSRRRWSGEDTGKRKGEGKKIFLCSSSSPYVKEHRPRRGT